MSKESEFYYGLPEVLWNNLMVQAEDLLRDEGLGNHIVGIYPAGERIYGIESGVEGIMCLYVDTVESLINPLFKSTNPDGFKVYKVNTYLSPIIMVNLFDWVKWIATYTEDKTPEECWKQHAFLHVIPFGPVFYQDNSIDEILEAARKYLVATRFTKETIFNSADDGKDQIFGPNLLFRRADCLLACTGKFNPNVNTDWGPVLDIGTITQDKNIIKLDEACRTKTLGNIKINFHEDLEVYRWYMDMTSRNRMNLITCNDLVDDLGKATERLYRFQL